MKKNGKKLDATLEQSLAGYKAELAELEAGLQRAQAERADLEAKLPALRSAALLHDGGEVEHDALKAANARRMLLDEVCDAHRFDATKARAEVASLEAAIEQADIDARKAEINTLLSARDEHLKESVRKLAEVHAELTFATTAHEKANEIAAELKLPSADWHQAVRVVEAAARAHLTGVDLGRSARQTRNEAARMLSTAAPSAAPPT